MGFLKLIMKKYGALLPALGLLILSALLLVPLLWLGGRVKAHVKSSVQTADRIRSLSSRVPSKDQPVVIQQYMDQLEKEVQAIDTLMLQSSQRELVSYRTVYFPEPTETSDLIFKQFGTDYVAAIDQLLQSINAQDAPSLAEIRSRTGGRVGGAGVGAGGALDSRNIAKDPFVDALCTERAERISVYASPAAFMWYSFWQNYTFEGRSQAIMDCWDSQIAFWIYEDVVKTIQVLNSGSQRVSTSPVKRLLGVRFKGDVPVIGSEISGSGGVGGRPFLGGVQGTAGLRDEPNYILQSALEGGTAGGMVGSASTVSGLSNFVAKPWTARGGNDQIDVIHFAVSVIVDNRSVLAFMKELCSQKEHTFRQDFKADGRLVTSRHNAITILQNTISVVSPDSPEHQFYRYGSNAAMRLDLVCEYVLDRRGYDSIKPLGIKKRLGQAEGSTEQTGGYGIMPRF